MDKIQDLFKNNPILDEIGTPKQYNEYLNTIFPNSKIKDIVYHGSITGIKGKIANRAYFSTDKEYTQTFGFPVSSRKTKAYIINVSNPYYTKLPIAAVPEEAADEYFNPVWRIGKNDAVVGKDLGQEKGETIAVLEGGEIYELGSEEDIKMFKQFVLKNKRNMSFSKVFTKDWWSEALGLDESQPEATTSPYQNLVLSAMPKIEKTSMVFNFPIPDIQYAFETGREIVLSDEMWKNLENSKSYNIKSLDEAIQYALKLGIDPKPYIDYIKQGNDIPLPLVLNYGQGKNYLVGGEVILSLYRALGSIPTALQGVLNLQMHGSISPPITENVENKLNENQISIIKEFIKYAAESLKLQKLPNLTLSYNTNEAKERHTFGYFDPNTSKVWLYVKNRNVADILRTLAHELVHRKQDEEGKIDYNSGETGSEVENEANAQAGVLLRDFGKQHKEIYEGLKKNTKLNEAGEIENPYQWKKDFIDDDGNVFYSFNTPQNTYSVGIAYNGQNSYEAQFNTSEEMGLDTGEGVALRVLSTVSEILLAFIKEFEPDEVIARPIKTKGAEDARRFRIYGIYLKKNLAPGYTLLTIGDTYRLIKK
jgi:hypothetical protein